MTLILLVELIILWLYTEMSSFFYRHIGTWCMRFAWKHWRVTEAKIKEKNAERSAWNEYGKMSTLELEKESIIWLCLQSFIIKTLKRYLEFCKLTTAAITKDLTVRAVNENSKA